MYLTSRFEEALTYAARLHARQLRKGTQTPYFSHLMGVAALVLEHGGDEDQAIAALLHDAVEDQGGLETLGQIRTLFGEQVAYLVEGCTDAYQTPKPPWRQRKEQYIQHLRGAKDDVRLISLADKVHNARSILNTLRCEGQRTWERFKGGRDGTLWYYQTLVEVFQADQQPTCGIKLLTQELATVVAEIQQLC